MKFEEILPLMREGKNAKCGNTPGYYTICKSKLFDMDLGKTIYRVDPDLNSRDIFSWGIHGNAVLSEEWEIYESEDKEEAKK